MVGYADRFSDRATSFKIYFHNLKTVLMYIEIPKQTLKIPLECQEINRKFKKYYQLKVLYL